MYNLVMKDVRLAVPPFFFLFPFLFGTLMFIPGWIFTLLSRCISAGSRFRMCSTNLKRKTI